MREITNERVLDQLNLSPSSSSSKRIVRIIELLKQARQMNAAFQNFFGNREHMVAFFRDRRVTNLDRSQPFYCTQLRVDHFPEIQAHNEKLNAVLTELYKLTARYRWRYVVRYPGSPSIREMWMLHEPVAQSSADSSEGFVVGWILSSQTHVDRIRRCDDCTKWFYAFTEHQKFCADRCRKHYAARSEEFRKKRAIYMRERYRPTVKEREQLAKRQATARSKGTKA